MAARRPIVITIAVILGMIGAILGLIGSIAALAILPLIGIIMVAVSILQIAILVGLWNMRRWALITYTVLFVVSLFGGNIRWWDIVIPVLVIIFGFLHYREMD